MDAGRTERVVLVHDWLTGMRGGEKCLEPLCRRWPDARLIHAAAQARQRVADHRARRESAPAPRTASRGSSGITATSCR